MWKRRPARVTLELDSFAAAALEEQARSFEISLEDLVGFSVFYYLADVDSGRIAREITMSPYPGSSPKPRRGARPTDCTARTSLF